MGVFTKNNEEFESKNEIKFEGNSKESELENILFSNPSIFPVTHITGEAESWIPLARQLSIDNHGKLDILATDNVGNLYVVECKIMGNHDMKTIRGQITDYIAGLWAQKDNWDDFQKSIKKSLGGKSIEEILKEDMGDDFQDRFDYLKQNFEDGKYFLVFAVDRISPGMREAINWHNSELDTSNKYPCFAIEIKKYLGDNNSEFIVTQNFPFDLNELKIKKEKNETSFKNNKEDWRRVFDKSEFSDEQRKQILDFEKSLEKMIKDDGGDIGYGRGRLLPRMMPKFNNTSTRSAMGLLANGVMALQFGLITENYPEIGTQFKDKISEINDIQKIIGVTPKSEKYIPIEKWLPHKDKILYILKDVFVQQ